MVRGVLLAHLWPFVWGLPFLGLTCVRAGVEGLNAGPPQDSPSSAAWSETRNQGGKGAGGGSLPGCV